MTEPTTPTGKALAETHTCYVRADILAIEREARDPWLNVALDRERERDAERAIADRLAEALKAFVAADDVHEGHECSPGFCSDMIEMDFTDAMPAARAALTAYKEVRK
jgi:hypothetical protein